MLDQEIGLTFKGLMSLIKNNPLNETSKIKEQWRIFRTF